NRKRRTAAEPIIEEPPREWRNQPALMPGQQKRTAYLPLIWIAGQDWKITSLLCACHALVMRVVMRLLCALLCACYARCYAIVMRIKGGSPPMRMHNKFRSVGHLPPVGTTVCPLS